MTDEEMVANLCADRVHQEIAIKHLYFSKGAEFGRFFLSRGVGKAEAEDVLQETILSILKNVGSFRGDGRFESWMWQIARSALSDHKRAARRRLDVPSPEATEMAETDPRLWATDEPDPTRQAEKCVSDGLSRFAIREPDRAYAIGLMVDGFDGEDIALRIGRSYDATRQYLTQCRKQLAPFISHCLDMLPT